MFPMVFLWIWVVQDSAHQPYIYIYIYIYIRANPVPRRFRYNPEEKNATNCCSNLASVTLIFNENQWFC